MEEYLSFKNQILNMSGRNQREPYFPRDAQPLRPRPIDYANKMHHISPQIQTNANRSKTAEKIRGNNSYIDPSVQYRSNQRTPSNNYYGVENKLNTSVDYRSNGGRRSSETSANQQKAKFLFFALQKCMRKAMWKTFLNKLEQCKTAHSISYHVPQSLSKTLPLDEISGINDSRSINYSDIRHPNVSYIDHHYTPYTDVQNSFVQPRSSSKPNHQHAYQYSNQKGKNASFSAILPELQNEWSPDTNNEIFFPRSNGTNSNSQRHIDPNQLNIQGYASNSSWGRTKYLDAYSSQPNTKAPLAKNTSQRSSFYNPKDYQSNPVTVTAGSYMLSNTTKDKNYELFSLLLKKTLEGFQKNSKAISFAELKDFYKRDLENEKDNKGNITREDGSLEPIATLEESNLLEYSNRTLLSPSNAVFPVHLSARQQKMNEIMNREKKLKTQLLVTTLQKTFSLRMKESFTRITLSDENDKSHVKNGGRILLLALFLQKKIGQQLHCSFDGIKSYSREAENYRSQQVQKGLLLQLLLRKSIVIRKSQALNRWREFVARARQADHEKKDVLLSKNLNSMATKYKDITNSYEKINKRYTEFCQRPRKSTSGNEDSISMSFTHDPLDKENLNKGQAVINTPSKNGSIRKVSSMSWAKQKSVEGLAEMMSLRLLRDAFNQMKKRPFFINIQALTEIEKSNKLQPKTTNGTVSLDLKISKSLLETFQQSAKKQPPQSETKSSQNANPDLLSAINFLKGL